MSEELDFIAIIKAAHPDWTMEQVRKYVNEKMGQIAESLLQDKGVTMAGPEGIRRIELPKNVGDSVTNRAHKRTQES